MSIEFGVRKFDFEFRFCFLLVINIWINFRFFELFVWLFVKWK